ncbi:hypothetical protein K1719_016559 [Acacia pycnantha]|nr:hypothetical protein K1719_016559 [Acacia pycnantha]
MELSYSKLSVSFFIFLFALIANAQDSPQDYVDAHNAARSQLIHSGGGGKYGENLAGSTGDLSGAAAVKLWVDEKADYDYNSNSCAAGKQCGHYTQVVWRNSIRVGCAKVKCNNGGTFIGCNYDPPGNYVGQKPY